MSRGSFDDGNSDEARQFLLDRRCQRNHPKRHGTTKRAKALSSAKKRRLAHRLAVNQAARAKRQAAVRRYWAGLGDHPE